MRNGNIQDIFLAISWLDIFLVISWLFCLAAGFVTGLEYRQTNADKLKDDGTTLINGWEKIRNPERNPEMTKKNEKPVASLTVYGLNKMSIKEINSLTRWLHKTANNITEDLSAGKQYSSRFVARFFK